MPNVLQDSYIVIAERTSTSDIGQIIEDEIDQVEAYMKQRPPFVAGGVSYHWWHSNRIQRAETLRGAVLTFVPAGGM